MLLAYLEGAPKIITADYPYGLRSIWREQLLLEAVQKRQAAKHILQNIHHDTQFIPAIKLESLPEFANNLRKQVTWLHNILAMELDAVSPMQENSGAKKLVKIYNTLEKSGILREVSKSTNELQRSR